MKFWRFCVALAATMVAWVAIAVTTVGYEEFGDTAGVVLWRGTEDNFHASTVIDVAEDGTQGTAYAMTADQSATSWQRFASNQSAYSSPGKVLVYDVPGEGEGYKYNANATFAPLSFGGMWVKTLAINGLPFSIVGSGTRYTELGASGKTTLFKFDKSYTFNRQGKTSFIGNVKVDIADGAIFKTQQDYTGQISEVASGSSLTLTGAGSIVVTTLNVGGTLDISAATRPTITGNVTLAALSTLVLPAGTEPTTVAPFTVCSGTLTAEGVVNVKVGTDEAVSCLLTVDGGTITQIEVVGETERTYGVEETCPSKVPGGCTYTFVGGATEDEAKTIDGVTVIGTLKTKGYVNLTNLTINDGALVEVVDSKATLTAKTVGGGGSISGNITIDANAVCEFTQTDFLNYSNSGVQTINVYGTLALGAHRLSLRTAASCVFNLYAGSKVTGTGDDIAMLDLFEGTSKLNAYPGESGGEIDIEGLVRSRNANTPIWVGANTTLKLNGGFSGGKGDVDSSGGINKSGNGTLAIYGNMSSLAASTVSEGTLSVIGSAKEPLPLTVNASSTASFTASQDETINVEITMKANANINMDGDGSIYGEITCEGKPGTVTGLVNSRWKGTVELPAMDTGSTANDLSYLAELGSSESKIVLNGISGNSVFVQNGTIINTNIRLDGDLILNNGSSGATNTLGTISGSSDLSLQTWSNSRGIRYNMNFDSYAGTLRPGNRSVSSGTLTIGIESVKKKDAIIGSVLIPVEETNADGANGKIVYNLESCYVNGVETNLCFDTVNDVTGIYIAAAKNKLTGNSYASIYNALAAIGEDGDITKIQVVDSTAMIPAGYKLGDDGYLALDNVVAYLFDNYSVEESSYDSVSDAIDAFSAKTEGDWTLYLMSGDTTVGSVSVRDGVVLSFYIPEDVKGGKLTIDNAIVEAGGTLYLDADVVKVGTANVAGSLEIFYPTEPMNVVLTAKESSCAVYCNDPSDDYVAVSTTVTGAEIVCEEETTGTGIKIYTLLGGEEDDGSKVIEVYDSKFTLSKTMIDTIASAMGVSTDNEDEFAKASFAYLVGGSFKDGTVFIPMPDISIVSDKATIEFKCVGAKYDDYKIDCRLEFANEIGASIDWKDYDPKKTITMTSGTATFDDIIVADRRFYRVVVTVNDKTE